MAETAITLSSEQQSLPMSIADANPYSLDRKAKRIYDAHFGATESFIRTVKEILPRHSLLSAGVRTFSYAAQLAALEITQSAHSLTARYCAIADKTDEMTAEARGCLLNDTLLMEVVGKAVNIIRGLVENRYREHQIRIYLSKDKEVPNWEEIVVSVGVKEDDFDVILRFWDELGMEVQHAIDKIKQDRKQDALRFEEISDTLAIEVDRLKNV